MEEKLPTRKVLYNIASMRKFVSQLLNNGKDYNNLLKFICVHDYYDEDVQLPSLKIIHENKVY